MGNGVADVGVLVIGNDKALMVVGIMVRGSKSPGRASDEEMESGGGNMR